MGPTMKQKTQKLWAVANAKGQLVVSEPDLHSLGALLIFKNKWRAEAAKWKPGEKVVAVTIAMGSE